jgi:hypothetical protein
MAVCQLKIACCLWNMAKMLRKQGKLYYSCMTALYCLSSDQIYPRKVPYGLSRGKYICLAMAGTSCTFC